MSVYKCVNINCERYNKESPILKMKYVIRDGEFVPYTPVICVNCKAEMQHVKENKVEAGMPNYLRFNGLSDGEKKRILKKRSDEHYKKKGKEKKREYFKTAMRRMTE